jgi:hypothetical protein
LHALKEASMMMISRWMTKARSLSEIMIESVVALLILKLSSFGLGSW